MVMILHCHQAPAKGAPLLSDDGVNNDDEEDDDSNDVDDNNIYNSDHASS